MQLRMQGKWRGRLQERLQLLQRLVNTPCKGRSGKGLRSKQGVRQSKHEKEGGESRDNKQGREVVEK